MITFTYQYDEHGWATSYISDGVNSLYMYPSLVTGGDIEDLAERLVVLLKMDQQGVSIKQRCSWGHEPGEYRWVLENNISPGRDNSDRSNRSNLRIDILW